MALRCALPPEAAALGVVVALLALACDAPGKYPGRSAGRFEASADWTIRIETLRFHAQGWEMVSVDSTGAMRQVIPTGRRDPDGALDLAWVETSCSLEPRTVGKIGRLLDRSSFLDLPAVTTNPGLPGQAVRYRAWVGDVTHTVAVNGQPPALIFRFQYEFAGLLGECDLGERIVEGAELDRMQAQLRSGARSP